MEAKRWRCPDCKRTFGARNARHACVSLRPEDVLAAAPDTLPVFRAVRDVVAGWPGVVVEATKTQVGFCADRRFAWLWVPSLALGRGEQVLCLSFALPRREASSRVKEAVEAMPGWWTHHVMLPEASAVDDEVRTWLREAYETRGVR